MSADVAALQEMVDGNFQQLSYLPSQILPKDINGGIIPGYEHPEQDTLKSHYEFDYSKAKPNCFAARLTEDSLMVVLDPDVAAIFPTSEAVNDSLRGWLRLCRICPTRNHSNVVSSYRLRQERSSRSSPRY